MYTKLFIFALLGVTFVSATPIALEDGPNERSLNDFWGKWWDMVHKHYDDLYKLIRRSGKEIGGQIYAAGLSEEAIESIREKSSNENRDAYVKYVEDSNKLEQQIRKAIITGKAAFNKVQAEAIEALNKAYEAAKVRYEKINRELKEEIEKEKLAAQ